ncbi:hypothetical protein B0H10DRAFT_2344469 [Mycena sp. CBHHK59/15]|nr:hypothetical protein B0H10DRAFT_2344469 [Mycena sp. CBHHK59/15]
MFKLKLSVITVFLAQALSLHTPSAGAEEDVPTGGFSRSCTGAFLVGPSSLGANCRDGGNTTSYVAVDLNNCVGNRDGSLRSGCVRNYSRSCTGCSLSNNSVLSCTCSRINSGSMISRTNLGM